MGAVTALTMASAASAVSPWMVFFEPGSARIESRYDDTLDNIVTSFRAAKIQGLIVQGHTDRVGTSGANQLLSRRRAEAIKAALVARGLAAGAIQVEAMGEEQRLVDTPDGVEEAENRRAAIIITCLDDPDPNFGYMQCAK